MKQIPKKQFDEVVRLCREYWNTGDPENLKPQFDVAMEIEKATGINWLSITHFVDSIIHTRGILHGASNETLYVLLGVLGWEVAEIVEEHPAN